MKTFIAVLALVATTTAFAQRPPRPIPIPNPYPPTTPVWPRVMNYGHSAEISAWNHNRMGVMCSGSVTLRMASGAILRPYVSMFVPANGFRNHRIHITNPQDRIQYVSHNIWCR